MADKECSKCHRRLPRDRFYTSSWDGGPTSFDLTEPEQQKACFHFTNLQPLWAADNISKRAKVLGVAA